MQSEFFLDLNFWNISVLENIIGLVKREKIKKNPRYQNYLLGFYQLDQVGPFIDGKCFLVLKDFYTFQVSFCFYV